MRPENLEARMRERECFHSLRLMPGAWTIVRVDGRSFSRFTQTRFEKPFDEKFRDHMITAAGTLLENMRGIYAFTESDEISVLFAPDWSMFDRELEKIVSISAGIASSAFSLAAGCRVEFDSRVWLGSSPEDVLDYFHWRQNDASRCALNGWCYWTLRKEGAGVKDATAALKGFSVSDMNELLFQRGINFNDVPHWQRRGIGMYWKEYTKEGYNPVTGEKTLAVRRRLYADLTLPLKEEYGAFLRTLITEAGSDGHD